MKNWKKCCLIFGPETLLKWHKQVTRWVWTTFRSGRPPVNQDLKKLVIRIKLENRLWGAKRIHGEMMKLGFDISETTVRNILERANFNPWNRRPKLTWWQFIRRHQTVWGIDFFQVHTAFMQRLYVFVILNIQTRELICARVTSTPGTEWVCRVLKGELGFNDAPDLLIRDRDPAFSAEAFKDLLETSGVRCAVTPRRAPKANAFVERFNGTIQRECTDEFLFFNENQVQRALNEFKEYYNNKMSSGY